MNIRDLPRTRREAIKLNSKHYYTGKPCKRGHVTYRYTVGSACSICNRRKQSNMNARHKAAIEKYKSLDILEKPLPKDAGNTLYARPVERTIGPRGC